MQITISNKSKLDFPNKIALSNENKIGQVNFKNAPSGASVALSNVNKIGKVAFNKVSRAGSVFFDGLGTVVTTGQQDGDVLVFQANTNTYNIKTLPNIDGGIF